MSKALFSPLRRGWTEVRGEVSMDLSAVPAGHIPAYFYEIDSEDRIIAASSSWDEFARNNQGEHLILANVRGTKIWDHIADAQTADLYRKIFSRARSGKPVSFFLRCDSPTVRRLLSVTVERNDRGDRLAISTLLFRADIREEFDLRAGLDDVLSLQVPACSWCEKVKMPEVEWQEVEGAAAWLNEHQLPRKCQMSYTICPNCRQLIERQIALAG